MLARFPVSCVIAFTALVFAPAAPAQTKTQMQALQAADEAVERATVHSGVVSVIDQAKVTLPAGVDFIPADAFNQRLEALGGESDDAVGVFTPAAKSGKNWMVEVYFKPYGHIKDDDTKDWDQKKLLQNLQRNYERLNEQGRSSGEVEIEARGWLQPPEYDRVHHSLIWAIDGGVKGVQRPPNASERCSGVMLGREGLIELRLTSDRNKLAADIPVLRQLLDNLAYNEGKRYQDFNASTDEAADFSLALLLGAHVSE